MAVARRNLRFSVPRMDSDLSMCMPEQLTYLFRHVQTAGQGTARRGGRGSRGRRDLPVRLRRQLLLGACAGAYPLRTGTQTDRYSLAATPRLT